VLTEAAWREMVKHCRLLCRSRQAARRCTETTRLCRLAPSLGGPETLLSHPASTTHRQYDAEALAAAGIGEGMVRVSVGLEDPADLIDDLDAAFQCVFDSPYVDADCFRESHPVVDPAATLLSQLL
jgi:hypothetical protein